VASAEEQKQCEEPHDKGFVVGGNDSAIGALGVDLDRMRLHSTGAR